MKIFIIDDGYPNNDTLYGDVFAHVRVKEYLKKHICVVGSFMHKKSYIYEGVEVQAFSTTQNMVTYIENFKPDVILVHFAMKPFIDNVILKFQCKYVIWVHGYEALGWYRRLFNLTWRNFFPRGFYNMVRNNVNQLKSFKRLIDLSNQGKNIEFIFVSNWMKKICEQDTFSKVNNFNILPNPIDYRLFKYVEKEVDKRFNILMIRPFDSKKYATDIAIKAIQYLQKKEIFDQLTFHIYGKGEKFKKATLSLSHLKNVKLYEKFLPQKEIPLIHEKFGIFLTPTRQDAQGVSMCEAMSSGLIPISSNNTAIPEFVTHGESGFLTKNAKEIADTIVFLVNNPDVFKLISKNASKAIKSKAGLDFIIQKELEIIEKVILQ